MSSEPVSITRATAVGPTSSASCIVASLMIGRDLTEAATSQRAQALPDEAWNAAEPGLHRIIRFVLVILLVIVIAVE